MIQVLQRLAGIGDGILGLTTVCGMKTKHPTETVVYSCHPNSHPWVSLFTGYDALTDLTFECHVSYDISKSLHWEMTARGGDRGRAEWYAACCGNIMPQNPVAKPLPRSPQPGCVVLCPLTSRWTQREWLLPNWMALEQKLLELGLKTVVVARDPVKVRQLSSPKFTGPPNRIASLIKEALLVVGVDSGLLHLCGALGSQGIVLAGPTLGRLVFKNWPTIHAIEGDALPCHGCYSQDIPECCITTCAALNQTKPDFVLNQILKTVANAPRMIPLQSTDGQRPDPITGEIQPWYTHSSLDEIQEWDLQKKVVLEWGGGHSTLWWGKRCRRVFTIETKPVWCEWIAARALAQGLTNITVVQRDPNVSMEQYLKIPKGCSPDIVIIDDDKGFDCLRAALTLPRPLTIIFDNWQQEEVFISPEAEALMKSFVGATYADEPQISRRKNPWQTAIWHLT